MNTAFLAIFQRHRHLDKVPVPAQDRHWPKPIDPVPAPTGTGPKNRILSLQRFLRSFSGTGTWIKFRFRQKTDTDQNQVTQYRPKKGHDEYFSVPVLDRLVSISAGLVPGPALCPGAGAAERSQETLYVKKSRWFQIWSQNSFMY